MEAFFVSAAVIAVAEIGDKTQLLALMLAARYRKPVPIILGILFATLANHALAARARRRGRGLGRRRYDALDPGRSLHRHGGLVPDPRQGR